MSERILNDLQNAALNNPEWAEIAPWLNDPNRGVHLAILREPYLGWVLDGTKTVESRFSVNKIAPFGQIVAGDLVVVKGGKGAVGAFTAAEVDCRQISGPGDLLAIRQEHGQGICAPNEFWEAQIAKKFATLVLVGEARPLPPVPVQKRDMRGWVVLRHSRQPQLFA